MLEQGGITNALLVADKEHFTRQIGAYFYKHPAFDILMPAPLTQRVCKCFDSLQYKPPWAGYALATTTFRFEDSPLDFQLIVQRQGEKPEKYDYKAFLTTSSNDPVDLLTKVFPQRWTIEEFFNFNGDMGWNRASTFNLNIRYGTAQQVLTNTEGDLRVEDDTVIVTYYRDHEKLGLKQHYQNLPQKLQSQGINPKIPWLFDFKLDFRFK